MAMLAASLGGGLVSGLFGMEGAKSQANAEKYAAQLQSQEAANSLGFQQQEFNTQQQNEAPYLAAGNTDLGNLQSILAQPGQGWNQTFQAPTAAEAAAYPGYQFQEQQGQEALQNSAAAKGALYSGNTQEALAQYGQQSAQSDYSNVYNQAFQQYQQNYGQYNNQLNRLAAGAGIGQTAVGTSGQQGQAAASNVAGINLGSGAQIGQDIGNAATATASGYTALGNSLGGSMNNIPYLMAMQNLLGGSGSGGGTPNYGPSPDQPGFPG